MATSRDLAAFLIRAAATVVRLDLSLGTDDESFRRIAIGDMVDGVPVLDPWENLQDRLLAGEDPVGALSRAFSEQSTAYSEAAARAAVTIVERAVCHLQTAGSQDAVDAFLDDLQRGGREIAAES